MKCPIVVPIHDALDSVRDLLESIDSATPPAELILVNDCSGPSTSDYLTSFKSKRDKRGLKTVLLKNDKQQLFTRAVNRGIRYAVNQLSAEAVIVLNSDCTVELGWYNQLTNALTSDKRVGVAGFWDNSYPQDVDYRKKPYTEVKMPNYITGHCFILRVEMLKEIGVLCETDIDGRNDYTLAPYKGQAHIGSERMLCNKANVYGWKTVYCNTPVVFHGDGKSWGRNLQWLNQFDLQLLWEPNDTLEPEVFYG